MWMDGMVLYGLDDDDACRILVHVSLHMIDREIDVQRSVIDGSRPSFSPPPCGSCSALSVAGCLLLSPSLHKHRVRI